MGYGGGETSESATSGFASINETDIEVPDLLTDLREKTQLTRRSLNDFKRNPQEFIELCAEAINRTKRLALVDGIRYQYIGDERYYVQRLFQQEGAYRVSQK